MHHRAVAAVVVVAEVTKKQLSNLSIAAHLIQKESTRSVWE